MTKLVVGITSNKNTTLITGQLKYFKSIGYETYLLAPDHPQVREFCDREGCALLVAPLEREISFLSDFRAIWVIYKHFRSVKPDVINLGTMKVSLTGMIAGFFARVPYRIYTSRGFSALTEKGLKKLALLASLKVISVLSHKIICISKSIKENGINYRMFKETNSYVINKGSSNGVDLTLFDPNKINDEERLHLKEKLSITKDNFVFGYVGRLIDRKGVNELYESFSNYFALDSTIRLVVVGPIESIQLRKDKDILRKLQNHEGIIMVGRVDFKNVHLYMSVMDTFLLPAWWEGFGNVLIQAAAMGVPVISTFGLGTIDAVSNNFNGELVPTHDTVSLMQTMVKFKNNPDLLKTYAENGKAWAKNFEPEIIWEGMNKIYQNKL